MEVDFHEVFGKGGAMKRIFIAIHYMEIGGAEKALLGLLENMTPEKYNVDLFVYWHTGELMELIPEHIHLLPENPAYASFEKPLIQVLKKGHFGMIAARIWAKVSDWIHNRRLNGNIASILDEVGRATVTMLPSLHYLGEYDLAISFLNPHYIVRDKVLAKKKIAWIHTDYSSIIINNERELPVWDSYDHVISISESVTRAFLQQFPSLESKIIMVENCLPYQLIYKQSKEFDASNEMLGKVKLLSIGRYAYAKNFPGAVEIMAELCRLRDDVIWYLIGYGDEQAILDKIEELNMQGKFVLLGKKLNPYPYIKTCDMYVQPSLYEGKSIAVKEAQLLGKPVAITDFPTASSQLEDGVNGFIIPLDAYFAARKLNEWLNSPGLLKKISLGGLEKETMGRTGADPLVNIIKK